MISVDAGGAHRRRAGHVHLRGPRRRDPAPRPDPARGAAAAHDHPRWRRHGSRHRVDLLPQRAAPRVGAGDGRVHRRGRGASPAPPTTSTPTCSRPSPTPTARSATPPGCASSSSRSPSHVALRHVRFPDTAALQDAIATITETREWHGERVDALDGTAFEPGEYYLTLGRWDGRRADRAATTPARRSTGARSSSARSTCSPPTTTCGAGTPTGSGARGRSAPSTRWCAGSGRGACKRSDVYHRLVGLDLRYGIADRLDRRAGRPAARARGPGHRGARRAARGVPRLVRRGGRHAPGLAVPACACAASSVAGRRTPSSRDAPTSTSASGARSTSATTRPRARATGRSRPRSSELDGHKSLYSESFYDRETFDRLYDGPHLAAVKQRYDPDDRLTSLYDKAVRQR